MSTVWTISSSLQKKQESCTVKNNTELLTETNTKINLILGAFTKLRKATLGFVMSVHPSVRMEKLGSHWKDFREI
jgi:hypothetical protein